MARNTHKGIGNNRRPVNRSNGKQRMRDTEAVLDFLKERANKDK